MEEGAAKPVEEMVQTATGRILVARQGDPRKPAIFTYHDIALNYLSNFHVSQSDTVEIVPCRTANSIHYY